MENEIPPLNPQSELEPEHKSNSLWVIILAFVVTVLLVGGGFYYYQDQLLGVNTQPETNQNTLVNNTNEVVDIPDEAVEMEWQSYEDTILGLSFDYPDDPSYILDVSTQRTTLSNEDEGFRMHITKMDIEPTEEEYEIKYKSDIKRFNGMAYREFYREGMGNPYGYVLTNDHFGGYHMFESVYGPSNEIFETIMDTVSFVGSVPSSDWQTYNDEEYNFSVQYPDEWVAEAGSNLYYGVAFRPITLTHDFLWGIFIYDDDYRTVEKIIADMGDQFLPQRDEVRKNISFNGIDALEVVVTTSKDPELYSDWYYKNIIFEKDNKIYVISNGAVTDDAFDIFYQSFKFLEDTSDWQTYTDQAAGFSLQYPKNLFINELNHATDEKSTLFITVEAIDDLPEAAPFAMGKESAIEDRALLSQGQFGITNYGGREYTQDVLSIDNHYVKIFTGFGVLEICNVEFSRRLIFYNNDYRVYISLIGPANKIKNSMSSYFDAPPNDCDPNSTHLDEPILYSIWDYSNENIREDFYNTLIIGNGSDVAQEWFDIFDQIVNSIEIN
ncbi:hypothetical protein K8R42_01940 [bacterium]|nr:hypothetical protein [bacterium]